MHPHNPEHFIVAPPLDMAASVAYRSMVGFSLFSVNSLLIPLILDFDHPRRGSRGGVKLRDRKELALSFMRCF